eukprot:8427456-Pyramimonas_sp.AAC.1
MAACRSDGAPSSQPGPHSTFLATIPQAGFAAERPASSSSNSGASPRSARRRSSSEPAMPPRSTTPFPALAVARLAGLPTQ